MGARRVSQVPLAAFTINFPNRTFVLLDDKIGVSEAYDPQSGLKQPPIKQFLGIWDTGASASVITQRVVSALGLHYSDETTVHTANGDRLAHVYDVNIYLRNNVGFSGFEVTDGDIAGADILIGMDIIASGDFAVTHVGNKTSMSFQVPSIQTIDFVKDAEQNDKNNKQSVQKQRNRDKAARRKRRGK